MTMKTEGDLALKRSFDALGEKVYKKYARLAVAKGGRVVKKAMKSEVPVESGSMKKALHSKVKTYKKSGNVVAIIGPRADLQFIVTLPDGRTQKRVPANYAHLVELGTTHSPANPFMRRAFHSSASETERAIIDGIWNGIKTEARKKH